MREELGQFEITSGKMRVTDPCYDVHTWCSGEIPNAKNGKWAAAAIINEEGRVMELTVSHVDHPEVLAGCVSAIDVGVDSGQAGFFDAVKYVENQVGDTFYDKVCELTTDTRRFGTAQNGNGGVMEFGAVSRTGYGDGGYVCYTGTENQEVVTAKIIFIEENDEDYEDEEIEEEIEEDNC